MTTIDSRITCPACDTDEIAKAEMPLTLEDVALFRCEACGARVVFGALMPRMVAEPFVDESGRNWLRQRFQDPKTKADIYIVDIDPQAAASHAKNILSLVLP